MKSDTMIPAGLASIAAGLDFIKTSEFAQVVSLASQTVRKNYCLTGECYGIRPVKLGNSHHLLWPVRETAELLNRGR
jgi:hypothetical protein